MVFNSQLIFGVSITHDNTTTVQTILSERKEQMRVFASQINWRISAADSNQTTAQPRAT
jgi:hypothetical protein